MNEKVSELINQFCSFADICLNGELPLEVKKFDDVLNDGTTWGGIPSADEPSHPASLDKY
mgnify:CR=1 FL=1